MMARDDRRPRPHVDEESRGFWEGLARHELWLQRCGSCGTLRHPPRAVCPACMADTLDWVQASGRGAVYTFTVTHQNHAPGFRARLPYVLAYVELEEGVRLLTNVVGCDPADVHVGMPVTITYDDVDEGLTLPLFRPRS